MSTATFRVSTDILQRLGEELVTSFDQGVVELVKNSYDADALECTIELKDTGRPGGTLVITDDGDGMSIEDIRDGWLVLGRSRKVPRDRTRRRADFRLVARDWGVLGPSGWVTKCCLSRVRGTNPRPSTQSAYVGLISPDGMS